jgi:hypothetical protein
MLKFLFIGLIISVFLVSGCVDRTTEGTTTTTIESPEAPVTGAMTEDDALETIEQEMEEAIENMSIEEIEGSLLE